MKRLLLVLVLIAVAISGCTEKGPSEKSVNADTLKNLSLNSAENLTSYSLKSSVTQNLVLNAVGKNATPDNATKVSESAETTALVNLTSFLASASGSTKSQVELPGKQANSSSARAEVFQIGNSTYVLDESGNWTHLLDPRSAKEIWGDGNNNQVKALAGTVMQAQVEELGTENVNGQDAYKLKILIGSGDYTNLYNTAFGIAAKLTQYPMLMPYINNTELNESGKIEKIVWISKESYLPVKYQSSMSFKMTPEVIGGLDPGTGQMKKFNQSVRLGTISVSIETSDLYYDFNKHVAIAPPAKALEAKAISPTNIGTTL